MLVAATNTNASEQYACARARSVWRSGPGVECGGDVTRRRDRRLRLQQHVGTHVLDGLEAADRAAELKARPGVIGGHPHRVRGAAGLFGDQCHRGDVERMGQHRRAAVGRPTNRAGVPASVRVPCLRVWSTVFDPLISRPGAVRSTAKIAVPEPVRAYT